MKRILTWIMVLVMFLGASSAYAISTDYQDWTSWPVTDEDITVTIAIKVNNDAADCYPMEGWLWPWISEKSGLNFEFEGILNSALSEKKSLMFAADDLPDVLWGLGLSTMELVKYGQDEGQLMPLNEYITPEIMPNLSAWIEAYPEITGIITAPDGIIYTLPYMYKVLRPAGGSSRIFISDMYLDELGYEKPETLDDLNEILYAFKEAHPDLVPIAGSSNGYDIRDFFLNAYGYLTTGGNNYGTQIALRDDTLLLPCADASFYAYLELMHQYYVDGIISQDYFLLDSDSIKAALLDNRHMLQEGTTIGDTYEQWVNWSAQAPLTSELSDTRQWLSANLFQIGGFAMSSYCEYPEEVLRMCDFMFSDLASVWMWYGPIEGHSDLEGYENVGWYYDQDEQLRFVGVENGLYAGEWINGLYTCSPAGNVVGNNGYALTEPDLTCVYDIMRSIAGFEDTRYPWNVTGNIDNYFRASMEEVVSPYETSDFPYTIYLTSEQNARASELYTVIAPFVETEVAEFITGARPLSEFDTFIEELESMGIREYEEIYREATGIQ